jgi:hypothetical protein
VEKLERHRAPERGSHHRVDGVRREERPLHVHAAAEDGLEARPHGVARHLVELRLHHWPQNAHGHVVLFPGDVSVTRILGG